MLPVMFLSSGEKKSKSKKHQTLDERFKIMMKTGLRMA